VRETLTESLRLSVCVDCYYWLHYGWEEGQCYSEGYSGPIDTELLESDVVLPQCDLDGEPLGPHFGKRHCEGCYSPLAGDRFEIVTYVREELT